MVERGLARFISLGEECAIGGGGDPSGRECTLVGDPSEELVAGRILARFIPLDPWEECAIGGGDPSGVWGECTLAGDPSEELVVVERSLARFIPLDPWEECALGGGDPSGVWGECTLAGDPSEELVVSRSLAHLLYAREECALGGGDPSEVSGEGGGDPAASSSAVPSLDTSITDGGGPSLSDITMNSGPHPCTPESVAPPWSEEEALLP